MRLLDLFSGIGGFSLAAQEVWGEELEIAGFCEIDKFCHKVLLKNFGDIPIHSDISTFDTSQFDSIDIITGGFPCQDISQAGREKIGIKGERSGLWSEMFRVISNLQPRFVIAENVPAITFRGLDRVLSDLASIRYNAEWQCISAAEVGARHKRDRFWLIAYPDSNELRCRSKGKSQKESERGINALCEPTSLYKDVPDSSSIRLQREKTNRELGRQLGLAKRNIENRISRRKDSKIESRVGGMADGLSYWSYEPRGIPRVTEKNKHRRDRIKGLGNSIVPQVAYQIMKRIKDIDGNKNTSTDIGSRNGGTRLNTC